MRDPDSLGGCDEAHMDLLRSEVSIIEETLSKLDNAVLHDAATALAKARKVRLLGYRNSRFLSDYLTAQLAQLRHDVAPLVLDGQTMSEGIAGLGPQDVAVLVGFRRRPAKFTEIVRLIAARGAKVLLVADKDLREAPAFATWTFICAVQTPLPIDSYAGALSLVRKLAIETTAALGDAGLHHLNDVETLREHLGELEAGPSEHSK